jgi:hypothetical protein
MLVPWHGAMAPRPPAAGAAVSFVTEICVGTGKARNHLIETILAFFMNLSHIFRASPP